MNGSLVYCLAKLIFGDELNYVLLVDQTRAVCGVEDRQNVGILCAGILKACLNSIIIHPFPLHVQRRPGKEEK